MYWIAIFSRPFSDFFYVAASRPAKSPRIHRSQIRLAICIVNGGKILRLGRAIENKRKGIRHSAAELPRGLVQRHPEKAETDRPATIEAVFLKVDPAIRIFSPQMEQETMAAMTDFLTLLQKTIVVNAERLERDLDDKAGLLEKLTRGSYVRRLSGLDRAPWHLQPLVRKIRFVENQ
jgi:hypothetical protein